MARLSRSVKDWIACATHSPPALVVRIEKVKWPLALVRSVVQHSLPPTSVPTHDAPDTTTECSEKPHAGATCLGGFLLAPSLVLPGRMLQSRMVTPE